MAQLQCTRKLLLQLNALPGAEATLPESKPGFLGDWCATLIPVEERVAALFMSQRSLLSFAILEGQRFNPEAIGKVFWGGLSQTLAQAGYKAAKVKQVVNSYSELVLAPIASKSQNAQLTNLGRDFAHFIEVSGGLERCDIGAAIQNINQRPREALQWETSEEVTRALLFAAGA
jgi:hypothetical protein